MLPVIFPVILLVLCLMWLPFSYHLEHQEGLRYSIKTEQFKRKPADTLPVTAPYLCC